MKVRNVAKLTWKSKKKTDGRETVPDADNAARSGHKSRIAKQTLNHTLGRWLYTKSSMDDEPASWPKLTSGKSPDRHPATCIVPKRTQTPNCEIRPHIALADPFPWTQSSEIVLRTVIMQQTKTFKNIRKLFGESAVRHATTFQWHGLFTISKEAVKNKRENLTTKMFDGMIWKKKKLCSYFVPHTCEQQQKRGSHPNV